MGEVRTAIMRIDIKSVIQIAAWSLYDLANQFFALNIVSLYFVKWLVLVKGVPELFYSVAFAVSIFFVAVLSPLLGAVSDAAQRHRLFLVIFTGVAVFFTMALGWTQNVILALVFFAVANLGCQLGSVFYNALMVNIAPPERIGFISGVGRMFGYSGAAVSVFLIKPIVLNFGYHETFVPTGFFFLVFALPCMVLVKDREPKGLKVQSVFSRELAVRVYQSFKKNFSSTSHYKGLFPFFQSIFFSLAAVNVLVLFMAVYASEVFKLDEAAVINLVAFAVLFCVGGSLFSGWLSDRIGCRRCLFLVYGLWICSFIAGGLVREPKYIVFIAAVVGIALGSVWVVIRAMAIRLVPQEKVGEMFGLFHVVGYSAAIMGALFWGTILFLAQPLGEWRYRLALLSLNLFILLGIFFLRKVPDPRDRRVLA